MQFLILRLTKFLHTSLVGYPHEDMTCIPPLTTPLYSKTGVCRGISIFSSLEPKAQKVSFGVGSIPALATCETSQVLLAGVSGFFSRGSPVFAAPTDWPV